MVTNTQIQQLKQWVKMVLENETDYFCVSIEIKPTNNFKIFLEGDNGLSIEKCVQFNRKLYKLIEESNTYPDGNFSLEISSPGIDEPLKLHRQYIKNIGRIIEVNFTNGEKKEGKLITVTDTEIMIEHTEGKGKKAFTEKLNIPFTQIKTTIVQIKF